MTIEITLVLTILAIAILLFMTEWVRMDVVALLVLGSLALTGLVTPEQALSGFSNPAVVTVWAILILSGGLARTGVASSIGNYMMRLAGDSEIRLLVFLLVTAGILSGFINTVGVVSLFLPVVIDIARRLKRPPSKILMPLAFAALMGGLNTLIGTPPNILISESLQNAGLRPFQMFEYAPIGLSVLLAGTVYLVLVGRHLLPTVDPARQFAAEGSQDFKSLYDLQERIVILHIPEDSMLNGRSLSESRLGSVLGLNVLAIIRNGRTIRSPEPAFTLKSGDHLLVGGRLEQFTELKGKDHLVLENEGFSLERLISADVQLVEASLSPDSKLISQTLKDIRFRHKYAVIVLAILREGIPYRTNLESIHLHADDILLIQGRSEDIEKLKSEPDFLISPPSSLQDYQLEERTSVVHIPPGSTMVGKSLIESHLGDAYGLGILGIIRSGETRLMLSPDEKLQANDILLVKGRFSDLNLIEGLQRLEIENDTTPDLGDLESEDIGLVEAVLSPHSTLAGKTLRELNFRFKYGLTIVAIWREGRAYRSNLRDIELRFGDALLLYGPRKRLRMLGREPDFLVLTEEAQEPPRREKIPVAVSIMALVLIPVIVGWVPIAISAIIGVALMIITRCLTMEEAYRYIEWKAVFLIAGMLPMGIAMDQSGAAQFLANGMLSVIGEMGPAVLIAGFFLVAALSSQVMPNPAVAVLLAPIALTTAGNLDISPYPLMMTVAVSASAAFLSPVGHAANLLVMGPGGYRFIDYFKVGLMLTVVTMVVSILVIPIFWPF